MAQRDEGLDRLEAFIAAAAETRANLQRNAERVRGLSENLMEQAADVEARLIELDDAIDAFDARYGDIVQIVLAIVIGVAVGVATAGLGPIAVPIALFTAYVAYLVLGEERQSIVSAGDIALLAYRALSGDSQRLRPILEAAGEEAEQAFEAFQALAARAAAGPGVLLEQALTAGH